MSLSLPAYSDYGCRPKSVLPSSILIQLQPDPGLPRSMQPSQPFLWLGVASFEGWTSLSQLEASRSGMGDFGLIPTCLGLPPFPLSHRMRYRQCGNLALAIPMRTTLGMEEKYEMSLDP